MGTRTAPIPVNADIGKLNMPMLDKRDDFVDPLGVKGIGEQGIGELGNVGTAAALANARHHATGKKLRALRFPLKDVGRVTALVASATVRPVAAAAPRL
jgi:xanthine dehydrogenase YagR molybdenum-binding subunit